ncbi:hypothetical protein JTB14_010460 [Gonioctena quinquepunctata]|nr:hypothetical protein JTB14_010460 [Gonioctena quinquepunctata]
MELSRIYAVKPSINKAGDAKRWLVNVLELCTGRREAINTAMEQLRDAVETKKLPSPGEKKRITRICIFSIAP